MLSTWNRGLEKATGVQHACPAILSLQDYIASRFHCEEFPRSHSIRNLSVTPLTIC